MPGKGAWILSSGECRTIKGFLNYRVLKLEWFYMQIYIAAEYRIEEERRRTEDHYS